MIMRNSSLRDVLLGIALTLVLLVCVANLVLVRQVTSRPGLTCPPVVLPRSLPCESIPVDYAAREPRCTNELLRAMNITNVYVTSPANLAGGTNDSQNNVAPHLSAR